MLGGDTDPDRPVTDVRRTNPVHDMGIKDGIPLLCFHQDAVTLGNGHRLVGFINQPGHWAPVVVVPHPSLETDKCASPAILKGSYAGCGGNGLRRLYKHISLRQRAE